MFQKFVKVLGGDPHKKEIDQLSKIVDQINKLEPAYEPLTDEQLCAKTQEFRERIQTAVEGVDNEKERRDREQEAAG